MVSSQMDYFYYIFPASGVKTYIFLPAIVSLFISFFTSMSGVSGAFLLLPFQMSILNYTAPSVSSTNFLYNIVGIPGGVYRFIREDRIVWPLTWVIIAGTLPGVFFGYYIRIKFLPNPASFKFFVGLVLSYIGIRVITSISKSPAKKDENCPSFRVENTTFTLRRIEYDFCGHRAGFDTLWMFLLAGVVGIIGGVYGIGGGAIIAPICVSIFGLPVYTVSGAALLGTFITSVVGIIFYSLVPVNGAVCPPDWQLGLMFGLGGLIGMYLGARAQRYVPERVIKGLLSIFIFFTAFNYIYQFVALKL